MILLQTKLNPDLLLNFFLYNSSINIGVTTNKNMFSNNVQTLSGLYKTNS
jgi:hypothetical protein